MHKYQFNFEVLEQQYIFFLTDCLTKMKRKIERNEKNIQMKH